MNPNLKKKAFAGVCIVPLIMGIVLFGSAWSLNYWQGWVFLVLYTITTGQLTLWSLKNDPALLERRMKGGPTAEQRPAQRIVMWGMTTAFVGLFVVSGLDHRFGWSNLSAPFVIVGDCLLVLSFYLFNLVFRENSFAASTIRISEGQKVISTGPYGVIRHPMYFAGLLFILSIPLALGSIWSLLVVIPTFPFMGWRIADEEKMLRTELGGYSEYCEKVKYRVIPGLY
jgi:protein-S-isoprenylcysteine O-methyltransferase Ste14